MRILLASNASYDPPRGGSTRSNLAWLRRLAAAGHACAVAASSVDGQRRSTLVDGISIHSIPSLSLHAAELGALIRETLPDWVLVSSEDLSHTLLREAARTAPGRWQEGGKLNLEPALRLGDELGGQEHGVGALVHGLLDPRVRYE